jgi:hypothetical protein
MPLNQDRPEPAGRPSPGRTPCGQGRPNEANSHHSINDMVAKHRFIYGKLKKDTESSIEYEIRRQKLKPMAYAYLKFIWFEKDKRRNPDNVSGGGPKFVLDSLVRCGILKNDGWSEVLGIKHGFVVGDEASVHIELTDKPEA